MLESQVEIPNTNIVLASKGFFPPTSTAEPVVLLQERKDTDHQCWTRIVFQICWHKAQACLSPSCCCNYEILSLKYEQWGKLCQPFPSRAPAPPPPATHRLATGQYKSVRWPLTHNNPYLHQALHTFVIFSQAEVCSGDVCVIVMYFFLFSVFSTESCGTFPPNEKVKVYILCNTFQIICTRIRQVHLDKYILVTADVPSGLLADLISESWGCCGFAET